MLALDRIHSTHTAQAGEGLASQQARGAGVYETQKRLSHDGFEMTWAVNVVAPYLLTALMLDLVTDRIVNVSSISASGHIDFNNLQQVAGRWVAAAPAGFFRPGEGATAAFTTSWVASPSLRTGGVTCFPVAVGVFQRHCSKRMPWY